MSKRKREVVGLGITAQEAAAAAAKAARERPVLSTDLEEWLWRTSEKIRRTCDEGKFVCELPRGPKCQWEPSQEMEAAIRAAGFTYYTEYDQCYNACYVCWQEPSATSDAADAPKEVMDAAAARALTESARKRLNEEKARSQAYTENEVDAFMGGLALERACNTGKSELWCSHAKLPLLKEAERRLTAKGYYAAAVDHNKGTHKAPLYNMVVRWEPTGIRVSRHFLNTCHKIKSDE